MNAQTEQRLVALLEKVERFIDSVSLEGMVEFKPRPAPTAEEVTDIIRREVVAIFEAELDTRLAEALNPLLDRITETVKSSIDSLPPAAPPSDGKRHLTVVPANGLVAIPSSVVEAVVSQDVSLDEPPEPPEDVTAPPVLSLPRGLLKVKQKTLVKIIDDHYDQVEPALKAIGCGGDCYKCPLPEPRAVSEEAQLDRCTTDLVQLLGLETPDFGIPNVTEL